MTTKDFERLYEAHFGMVYKYLMKLSGDSRLAEELTSDTFFKALAGIDSFRGLCSVSSGLCQIAKNSYFDYIKREGKNADSESLNAVEDRTAEVEQRVLEKALAVEIFSKVHDLKEPYKEVFLLRTLGELNFKAIAKIFGKSENWSCVTYHRAKNAIKDMMGLRNEDFVQCYEGYFAAVFGRYGQRGHAEACSGAHGGL